MSHSRDALLALVLGFFVAGCSSSQDVSDDTTPWVDLGHGLEAYAPLDDGDRIEMVFGVQGRWHVDLASHFGNTEPDEHITYYRIWDLERTDQVAYPVRAYLTQDEVFLREDGTFDQVGIRSVFAIADASEVANKDWLVEVELVVGKDVFVDERVVHVVDEEP